MRTMEELGDTVNEAVERSHEADEHGGGEHGGRERVGKFTLFVLRGPCAAGT